ncbi:MAG: iron-containing alcohol dehydrogenase [Candidatus Zixiibacteriota bacterium]
MLNFAFYLPTKLIFGVGEIAKAGTEAGRIGRHALIVTGKSAAKKHRIIDKVGGYLDAAGVKYTVFSEIEPNPRNTTIDKAAGIAREKGCDFIIGLGGGSAMDAAKGIAVSAAMNEPVWDFIYSGKAKPKPLTKAWPTMMIPTLAATSSESDSGGVITNWETHEKAVLGSPLLFPVTSIIDPELTVTVSKDYTIDGGIDIIAHVIESFFTGVKNTPIQDRFSMSIIKTVMENLPKVIKNPGDVEARSNISWCATVALCGIVNQGRGGSFPNHAIEHALSGYYDISHGRGLAILIPRIMRFTYEARPEKFAFMARELFGVTDGKPEIELAKMAVDKMVEFLNSVERNITLQDVGITDKSKFKNMAEDTIRIYGGGEYIENPRRIYKDDVIKILEMSTVAN